MMTLRLNSRNAARAASVCVIALSALLAPVSLAASPSPSRLPGVCGPPPSWIEGVVLPLESQGPFQACFSSRENLAEAVLSIANNRPYAQLITVPGGALDVAESSFASTLERELSTLLTNSTSGGGTSALLLSPGQTARLLIDRPPPGPAQPVHIDPAPDNAFAVGALAWRLLAAAAAHHLLSAGNRSCVARAVDGALSSPLHPELALRRMHSCVNASGLSGKPARLLQTLARRLLSGSFFEEVVHREGAERRLARVAFTIAPSNPNLRNPSIHLTTTNLGTLPSGERTIEHLTAAGGTPPYRFYFVPERGGPGVPTWLYLAPDGTLVVEPPIGVTAVYVQVEVVDSNGEHSLIVE
jgi:hypothetical protein